MNKKHGSFQFWKTFLLFAGIGCMEGLFLGHVDAFSGAFLWLEAFAGGFTATRMAGPAFSQKGAEEDSTH